MQNLKYLVDIHVQEYTTGKKITVISSNLKRYNQKTQK